MAKTNENKRKRFSNLSEAEAEDKRKRVNKQERDRQYKIKQAFIDLEILVFKTPSTNNKSQLQILHAAIEYIIHMDIYAIDKKDAGTQTGTMYPNNTYQIQNTVHPFQHMGFPPKAVMPAMTKHFPLDQSTFSCGADQTQSGNDNIQQSNVFRVGDHSYCVDYSNSQDWSNFNQARPSIHVGPRTEMGPSTQIRPRPRVELSGSLRNLTALTSSTDNPVELQEFPSSYLQSFDLPDEMCNVTSTFTSSTYTPQNTSLSRRLNSESVVQYVPQTSSRNVSHNIDVSRYVDGSRIMQDAAHTSQNVPQNTDIFRYRSSCMMQDAAQAPQNVPQTTDMSRHMMSSYIMQNPAQTVQYIPQNNDMSRYLSSSTVINDVVQTPQNVPLGRPVSSTFSFKW